MGNYSKDWTLTSEGVIHHDEGKFYYVGRGVHGNPVIIQKTPGNVFLTIVEGKVLCEMETILEDGMTPTYQWRAVRASVHNPNQPDLGGEPIFLGEGHSNSQRIMGPADTYWLLFLEENPDPEKYTLLTIEEVVMNTKDNFGKSALAMYLVLQLGRIFNDLPLEKK